MTIQSLTSQQRKALRSYRLLYRYGVILPLTVNIKEA